MAKVTLTIEDDFKDGNSVIKGAFNTEDGPAPLAPNLPPIATPAQMYMATIQRLWDQGVFNSLIRLCVPDMLYRNEQVKAQLARMESGSAILNAPGAPSAAPGPIIEGTAVELPPAANDASEAPGGAGHVPSTLADPVQLDEVLKAAGVAQPSEGGCST